MKQLFFLLLIITSLTSCNNTLQKDKNFKQLNANQTGIAFSNNLTETKELNYLNLHICIWAQGFLQVI